MTRTKVRSVRVDDELWGKAMDTALSRNESLSAAIKAFLRRYTKEKTS